MPNAADTMAAGWDDFLIALVPRIKKLALPDAQIDKDIARWSGRDLPYTSSIDAALSLAKTCLPARFGREVDALTPKQGIDVTFYVENDDSEYSGRHNLEACATLLAMLDYVLLHSHARALLQGEKK